MLPFLCEKLTTIFLAPSSVTQAAAHLPVLSASQPLLLFWDINRFVRLQTRHILSEDCVAHNLCVSSSRTSKYKKHITCESHEAVAGSVFCAAVQSFLCFASSLQCMVFLLFVETVLWPLASPAFTVNTNTFIILFVTFVILSCSFLSCCLPLL